jgi:4-diphosphocytidyl-2-C-methyl-D-erythritol kinase
MPASFDYCPVTSIWKAPVKINLFLHINSKRSDGYHNLQSVFQLLDYYDELRFSINDSGIIRRVLGNETVSESQDLMVRAAQLLQQRTNSSKGVDIAILKRIPSGAGLGGGSSNAATTLIALNYLWKTKLNQQVLMDLGLELGADVPIFIYGKNAWAEGIGEALSDIKTPNYYYLIAFVNQHTLTSEIFSHKLLTMTPKIGKIADFTKFSDTHNDCLQAAVNLENSIQIALDCLNTCENRLFNAKMSGTGSSVFTAFETQAQAQAALNKMPKKWISFTAKALKTSPILKWAVAKR